MKPREVDQKVFVERVNFGRDTRLFFLTEQFGETFSAVPAAIEDQKIEENSLHPPPFCTLTERQAQELLEGLWAAGFRPNHGASSVAHVEAMKYHLEDMRKLAFEGRGTRDLVERLVEVSEAIGAGIKNLEIET